MGTSETDSTSEFDTAEAVTDVCNITLPEAHHDIWKLGPKAVEIAYSICLAFYKLANPPGAFRRPAY